jgi:hypothetical protein
MPHLTTWKIISHTPRFKILILLKRWVALKGRLTFDCKVSHSERVTHLPRAALKAGVIHDLPPFIQDFPPDKGVLNAYFHEAIAKTFVTVHKTKSYEKTCVTSFSFISRSEIIYPKPL